MQTILTHSFFFCRICGCPNFPRVLNLLKVWEKCLHLMTLLGSEKRDKYMDFVLESGLDDVITDGWSHNSCSKSEPSEFCSGTEICDEFDFVSNFSSHSLASFSVNCTLASTRLFSLFTPSSSLPSIFDF